MNNPNEIRWIATRMFHAEDDPNLKFIIKIGEPEQVSEQEWRCPFIFTSSKEEIKIQYAHSVDGLGALINAIMGVRHQGIDKCGKKLVWLGKEVGHGVPRFIPNVINPEFTEHLEKMVEEEIKRYVEEKKGRAGN